jgi:methylmalonyl-CoA/ethylmalonyl-CoA epimerase
MFDIVDHIGFAVKDLDESIEFYTQTFGITEWERISMPDRHMEMGVTRMGDTLLELIMPTSEQGAIAKFISDKGPGVHHIAYRVEDIRAAMQELESKGVRMLDKEPRPGIHNTLIAFVHPKTGGQGVLMELVQHQDHH